MKIKVVTKPKKKREYVEQLSSKEYIVSVSEPPVEGRANSAIVKALAAYFKISPSLIILVSGQTSKIKFFEVPDALADFEILPKQKQLL